ncbi:MAG: hypothetical protein ACJZ36_03050 [Candidatus Pelagibacter sp.]
MDIDVGFSGIVNNGDSNAEISIGVETGLYENKLNKISEEKKSLNYTYKFKKNFYSGKNLVKERTILSQIHYSNPGGGVTVDLPNYKFFEDKSDLGKRIREGQRFHSGDIFSRGERVARDDSIYKSVYNPYYYTTSFKPKNIEIKGLEEIFLK